MVKILLLLAGGALGTLARYALSGFAHKLYSGTFPLGTLVVNVLGSFIIGLLWGIWENENIPSHWRTFTFIGILGGFTTFSSYTLESMNLFRDGETKLALFYILANNILGLLFVVVGFILAKAIVKMIKS